jgi:hypothetical protein
MAKAAQSKNKEDGRDDVAELSEKGTRFH